MPSSSTNWPVKIIRSAKRKKTIGAEVKEGVLIIRAPAEMTDEALQPHITSLQKRLKRKVEKHTAGHTDADLEKMARKINQKYYAGRLKWQSIRYVTNQNTRYGSCTPSQGTIRISHRLAAMPTWVIEYVVMHELAHLKEQNHGPRFWKLVNRYPLTERARGYLMAVGLEKDEENPKKI